MTQAKDKALDAIYRNTPFSQRPSVHDLDLGRPSHGSPDVDVCHCYDIPLSVSLQRLGQCYRLARIKEHTGTMFGLLL